MNGEAFGLLLQGCGVMLLVWLLIAPIVLWRSAFVDRVQAKLEEWGGKLWW